MSKSCSLLQKYMIQTFFFITFLFYEICIKVYVILQRVIEELILSYFFSYNQVLNKAEAYAIGSQATSSDSANRVGILSSRKLCLQPSKFSILFRLIHSVLCKNHHSFITLADAVREGEGLKPLPKFIFSFFSYLQFFQNFEKSSALTKLMMWKIKSMETT